MATYKYTPLQNSKQLTANSLQLGIFNFQKTIARSSAASVIPNLIQDLANAAKHRGYRIKYGMTEHTANCYLPPILQPKCFKNFIMSKNIILLSHSFGGLSPPNNRV